MLAEVNHVGPRKSIVHQLRERGVLAAQVDTVLFRYILLTSRSCLLTDKIMLAMHIGIIAGL